jgi:hypothetical protein
MIPVRSLNTVPSRPPEQRFLRSVEVVGVDLPLSTSDAVSCGSRSIPHDAPPCGLYAIPYEDDSAQISEVWNLASHPLAVRAVEEGVGSTCAARLPDMLCAG